jgi:hypothetical protein
MLAAGHRRTAGLAFISTAVLLAALLTPVGSAAQGNPRNPWEAEGYHPQHGTFSLAPWEQIDTLTGNVVLRFTDISLPGINGVDLRIERIYNTNTGTWRVGPPGPRSLYLESGSRYGSNPFIINADGSEEVAFRSAAGSEIFRTLSYAELDRASRSFKTPDGLVWQFDESGHVSTLDDAYGHRLLTYHYDTQHQLVGITQHVGDFDRRVSFGGDPLHPTSISWNVPTDPNWPTRSWGYRWEGTKLKEVTPPAGSP